MFRFLRLLGQGALESLQTLGRASTLWVLALWGLPKAADVPLAVKQFYNVGVLSLVIVCLSAFSIGAVISLQFYTQLVRFGAESTVGLGLALTPVVTALLFAGRAGSAITAEIGLMKTTEQLSSMEMMGVDPLHRIVAPRLWAGFFCLPLLTLIFCVIAIYGGAVVAVDWLGVDSGSFWYGMRDGVQIGRDIGNGMIKAVIFAVLVTWIAVFQGYDTIPTAEGIGEATTRTVVYSSIAILAFDFVLTLVMFGDFK